MSIPTFDTSYAVLGCGVYISSKEDPLGYVPYSPPADNKTEPPTQTQGGAQQRDPDAPAVNSENGQKAFQIEEADNDKLTALEQQWQDQKKSEEGNIGGVKLNSRGCASS